MQMEYENEIPNNILRLCESSLTVSALGGKMRTHIRRKDYTAPPPLLGKGSKNAYERGIQMLLLIVI